MSRKSAACLISPRSSFALSTDVSAEPPRVDHGGGGGAGGRSAFVVGATRCREISGLSVALELGPTPIRRIIASMSIIAGDFVPALSTDGLLNLRRSPRVGVLAAPRPLAFELCANPDMLSRCLPRAPRRTIGHTQAPALQPLIQSLNAPPERAVLQPSACACVSSSGQSGVRGGPCTRTNADLLTSPRWGVRAGRAVGGRPPAQGSPGEYVRSTDKSQNQ